VIWIANCPARCLYPCTPSLTNFLKKQISKKWYFYYLVWISLISSEMNFSAFEIMLRKYYLLWSNLYPPVFMWWRPGPSVSVFGDRAFQEVDKIK
jgi:hypothetical protein